MSIFANDTGTMPTLGAMTATDDVFGLVAEFSGMGSQPPNWRDNMGPGGGEVFTVTTAGGDVEAFSGTLYVPLAPLLTSHTVAPIADGYAQVTVSRNEDLVITWDARQTAQSIWALPLTDPATEIGWTFDAAAGTGTPSCPKTRSPGSEAK